MSCSLSLSCENIKWWIGRSAGDAKYYAASPPLITSSKGLLDPPIVYFFFGVGVADGAEAAAPDSSIPNVQCASIFLPSDFALRMTVHVLSRSFCVTW